MAMQRTMSNTMQTEIAHFLNDRKKFGTARATVLSFRRQGLAAENHDAPEFVAVWDASAGCYRRYSTTEAGRILHAVLKGATIEHTGGPRMAPTWTPFRVRLMLGSGVKAWRPGQV
jgi:hypothetical protein